MRILNGSIDLTKIDKTKIVTKGKDGKPFKNGGKYLSVTVFIADEEDKYGNDASITIAQTKEERESGEKRVYLGNLKTSYLSDEPNGSNTEKEEETDDLPF